ncbi:phosphoribosylanthranilate isomerase [Niabella terrae]
MQNFKVKVCGLTQIDQVRQLAELGVDYAGFIFYEKSPRYAPGRIAPDALKEIEGIQKVGVFVNTPPDQLAELVTAYGLDAVQLHGDELPEHYQDLVGRTRIIKALPIGRELPDVELLKRHSRYVDYFLFDTQTKSYGGSGKKFDWSVLKGLSLKQPYFLSGGLGPEDIADILRFAGQNNLYAIDVNSRFETSPGEKNISIIQQFVSDLKK